RETVWSPTAPAPAWAAARAALRSPTGEMRGEAAASRARFPEATPRSDRHRQRAGERRRRAVYETALEPRGRWVLTRAGAGAAAQERPMRPAAVAPESRPMGCS